ncbi:MAG: glycosyltransferase family 87 protein [Pseudomonadota bacterium]
MLTLRNFNGLLDARGLPLGADFITYWAASYLTQAGYPAAAYDSAQLLATELLVAPVKMVHTAWYYPPQFLMVTLPLASLSYALSYLAFSLCSLVLFVFAALTISKNRFAIALIACPAVFLNLAAGQNGLLTASLAALVLHYLERKPLLSGSLMGLLCIKPQLLILFPLVLICARQWRVLQAFVISSFCFALGSTLLLGPEVWPAFLNGLADAKHYLETDIPLARMPTVFALIRQAGGSLPIAYAGHALIALIALATVLQIWLRSQCLQTRSTALVAATLLISPYLFDYDLVWHALPIAWLYQLGSRHGWLRGERLILCLTWMLLLYIKLILYVMTGTVILAGAVISLALLWLAWRRAVTAS